MKQIASPHSMRGLLIRAGAMIAMAFGPGGAALHLSGTLPEDSRCLATQLGFSFIISALMLWAVAWLSSKVAPTAGRWIAATWLAVSVVLFIYCMRLFLYAASPWELYSFVAALVLLSAWVSTLPMSEYPGNISHELGDIPASYRVASNLVEGRGLQEDYVIGEFLGCKYHYVVRHPLYVYIASFFFRLFGKDSYCISLYSQCASALILLLTVSVPFIVSPGNLEAAWLAPGLLLVLGLIPTTFLLSALGAYTLPTGVVLLCMLSLGLDAETSGSGPWVLYTTCLWYLLWVRPESQLLMVISLMATGAMVAFTAPLWVAVCVFLCMITGSVLFWKNLPSIMDRLPPSFKNMHLFYLRYDENTKSFRPAYRSISHLMGLFNDCNMHSAEGLQAISAGNPAYDIKSHPLAFSKYLGKKWMELCKVVLLTYMLPSRSLYGRMPLVPTAAVVLAVSTVGVGNAQYLWVLMVFYAYLLTSVAFNDLWVRHVMPITPIITVYALVLMYEVVNSINFGWQHWTLLCSAGVIAFWRLLHEVWRIRYCKENSGFKGIFALLAGHVSRDTIVLNTYPQLFAFVLNCRSVGTTFLVDTLEHYVARYTPDFIVVDTVRGGDGLLHRLRERFGFYIPGYTLFVQSAEWGVIFKAIPKKEPASAEDNRVGF